MARVQAKSGGFIQPDISYPLYVSIQNDADPVSAVLNTGASFILPENYDSWDEGPHVIVIPGGSFATMRDGDLAVDTEFFVVVTGMQMVTSAGSVMIPGDEVWEDVGDITELWTTVPYGDDELWVTVSHDPEEKNWRGGS